MIKEADKYKKTNGDRADFLSCSVPLRICGSILLFALAVAAQTSDLTRWVNPFIGTGGHGHTFPGATLPFGMVQLSPDTRIDNWDGSSGYHYSDDIIYGFSHTHLSGTGIPDGCDILFMPTSDSTQKFGAPTDYKQGTYEGFSSRFSHADEVAEPGYYSVRLNNRKLLAELSATTRVGIHRYTFPKSTNAGVDLDLLWRDKTIDRDVKVIGDRRIEGFRRSSSWAKNQTVYFVAEFSKPFKGYGTGRPSQLDDDKDDGIFFGFETREGEKILLKVAISYVSIEGARKNLKAELPGWDFDKVRADAKAAWNKQLSKIEVSGGTDEQATNFYTALYHTMIHPNVVNDVDGQYRGHDGKIHSLQRPAREQGRKNRRRSTTPSVEAAATPPIQGGELSNQYTVFSLWDTFRAAHPLYTIIDQKRAVDFINTFIRIYEQGGRLPVWELWGEETDTMIGYHAVSVIADAMAKGIKGFDYEKAYQAAKHSAELDHFGLAAYKKRGYISMEDENESVSKTLEYAYNDWCIAQMASIALNLRRNGVRWNSRRGQSEKEVEEKVSDFREFSHRARNYENLFDPRLDFFVPRKNGGFVRPFAPNEVTFSFTEGNSWQYSFFVPHDVTRLIELMGGREYFAGKLIQLFTTEQKLTGREQPDITGLIGQYAHGNEPSHHIPYLFNYAGLPWRTQMYVRKIMDEFYKNSPDGLIGNEDCGQMSAWYVLSASGFYPVAPGSPEYAIGTPLFPEVIYRLENGRTFTVRAKSVSDKNIYVQNAKLNGALQRTPSITHSDVMKGSVLEFTMTDTPVANAFDQLPNIRNSPGSVAVPRIELGPGHIFMGTTTPDAKIYYTLDGSEPTERSTGYIVPFRLRADTVRVIKAVTVDSRGNRSQVVEAKFHKRPNDWTVKIASPYSTQYTGGGDEGLIDGIRGTVNFSSGEWQGYQGKTFEGVIDLQRQEEINLVGGSFLQSARSWIWMPDRIEFDASTDGTNFTKIADFKPGFPQQEMNPVMQDFRKAVPPTKARYIRVRAYNIGKIPAWHPGAGGDPWIFVDEIFID